MRLLLLGRSWIQSANHSIRWHQARKLLATAIHLTLLPRQLPRCFPHFHKILKITYSPIHIIRHLIRGPYKLDLTISIKISTRDSPPLSMQSPPLQLSRIRFFNHLIRRRLSTLTSLLTTVYLLPRPRRLPLSLPRFPHSCPRCSPLLLLPPPTKPPALHHLINYVTITPTRLARRTNQRSSKDQVEAKRILCLGRWEHHGVISSMAKTLGDIHNNRVVIREGERAESRYSLFSVSFFVLCFLVSSARFVPRMHAIHVHFVRSSSRLSMREKMRLQPESEIVNSEANTLSSGLGSISDNEGPLLGVQSSVPRTRIAFSFPTTFLQKLAQSLFPSLQRGIAIIHSASTRCTSLPFQTSLSRKTDHHPLKRQ